MAAAPDPEHDQRPEHWLLDHADRHFDAAREGGGQRDGQRDLIAREQLDCRGGWQPSAGWAAGQERGEQFARVGGVQPAQFRDAALAPFAPGSVSGGMAKRAGGIFGVGVGGQPGDA